MHNNNNNKTSINLKTLNSNTHLICVAFNFPISKTTHPSWIDELLLHFFNSCCISFNFFNCNWSSSVSSITTTISISFLQLQLKFFNFFNYYNNFHFHFLQLLLAVCLFISSIAIAFLLLLCCTVFYLGVGVFLHFLQPEKIWFPHIQKKRIYVKFFFGSIPQI